MFFGSVEADTGEILNIRHPNSGGGGNPLLIFQTALSNYCGGVGAEDTDWFKALEAQIPEPLCTFCQPLLGALCDGEWRYDLDEYDLYLKRAAEPKMSAEEFVQAVIGYENAWVDIEALKRCSDFLSAVLKVDSIKRGYVYDTEYLITDVEALSYTLSILVERGASEVRIRII
jgi:hypothetical protein